MALKPDQPDEKSLWNSEDEVWAVARWLRVEGDNELAEGRDPAAPIAQFLLNVEAVSPQWIDAMLKARTDRLTEQGDLSVGPPYPIP